MKNKFQNLLDEDISQSILEQQRNQKLYFKVNLILMNTVAVVLIAFIIIYPIGGLFEWWNFSFTTWGFSILFTTLHTIIALLAGMIVMDIKLSLLQHTKLLLEAKVNTDKKLEELQEEIRQLRE